MKLRDFGKSENDLGEWFPFGEDVPAPFEVRIRRIPHDVQQQLTKRYGQERFMTIEGVRIPHIERTLEESTNWLLDQAAWAWTGIREAEGKPISLEMADDEAAKLWSRLLKRDVARGEEVTINDGDLNADVKRRFLTQIRPYAQMTDTEGKRQRVDLGTFLVVKQALIAADAVKRSEDARKNS